MHEFLDTEMGNLLIPLHVGRWLDEKNNKRGSRQ